MWRRVSRFRSESFRKALPVKDRRRAAAGGRTSHRARPGRAGTDPPAASILGAIGVSDQGSTSTPIYTNHG